jgi:hypothetical protein
METLLFCAVCFFLEFIAIYFFWAVLWLLLEMQLGLVLILCNFITFWLLAKLTASPFP